jgi:predicted nucleic acid-binding protein
VILVDSNILIDIMGRDPLWFDWSKAQIGRAAMGTYLFINPVVVGELGWQFETTEQFQSLMAGLLIGIEPLDCRAGFLAGQAFHVYRKRRGSDSPRIPLPDFFMGGHATATGAAILTRDPRFYRSYFPEVPLITPDTKHD